MRGNFPSNRQDLVDAKSRFLRFSKNREIVIGHAENFAEHADDFVGVERVGHDRKKRGQPRIGRAVAFHIALRLDRHWQTGAPQCRRHRLQPGFARAKNCHLAPRIRRKFSQPRVRDPSREILCFDARPLIILEFSSFRQQLLRDQGHANDSSGKNFRTRLQFDEAHLSILVVQDFTKRCVHEIELLLVESKRNRKFQALAVLVGDQRFMNSSIII